MSNLSVDSDLNAFATSIWDGACKIFSELSPAEEMITILHAQQPDGGHVILPMPWSNQAERRVYLYLARALLSRNECFRYAVIAETWVIEHSSTKDTSVPDCRPMEHPDRKEMLMRIAADNHGAVCSRSADIIRDGDRRTLGETVDDMQGHDGALAHLLEVVATH